MGRRLSPVTLVLAGLALSAAVALPARSAARNSPQESLNSPLSYFSRANNLTNLRLPGSKPFYMRVIFQAYPGMDFSKPGHSHILTGPGVYQETWISPEQWWREVTFGAYHAVEIRANGIRKFRASSDYETSRVLMLLDALLQPIPRRFLEPELEKDPPAWHVQPSVLNNIHYVRVSSEERLANGQIYSEDFDLMSNGLLFRSDSEATLTTTWSNPAVFSDKVVPGRIKVQAMGRDLLTADVSIAPLGREASIVRIPGSAAAPGMTLRPFHWYEVKAARPLNSGFFFPGNIDRFAFRQIVDRHGKSREVEVLSAPDREVAHEVLLNLQKEEFRPATVDGSPCEEIYRYLY